MSSVNFSIASFDPKCISFPVQDKKWVSISESNSAYPLLLLYIAANKVDLVAPSQSFTADILPAKSKQSKIDSLICGSRVMLKIGYGEFSFTTNNGELFYALHQQVGEPVGTNCGPAIMSNLVLFSSTTAEALGSFISWIVETSEATEEGAFTCYGWHVRHQYWRMEAKIRSRPMPSVVLPSVIKQRLIADIEKFLAPRTKEFYTCNGIPYRRSYLFHGLPGTGKTSMVQALAGHFKRSVCYLMPTHPEMTDDSLREAMNRLPDEAIVVFEDIDALFSKQRENKISKSALTFSGLLNALDGIGNPSGQIYVLTTNLRDQLDHALIRNGRVDLHVEFTYAVAEQMALMWSNFYPQPAAASLAQKFADQVTQQLADQNLRVSTSGLQHFFVSQMDSTPEEALRNIHLIGEAIKQNSSEDMLQAAADAAATAAAEEQKDGAPSTTVAAATSVAEKETVTA